MLAADGFGGEVRRVGVADGKQRASAAMGGSGGRLVDVSNGRLLRDAVHLRASIAGQQLSTSNA